MRTTILHLMPALPWPQEDLVKMVIMVMIIMVVMVVVVIMVNMFIMVAPYASTALAPGGLGTVVFEHVVPHSKAH